MRTMIVYLILILSVSCNNNSSDNEFKGGIVNISGTIENYKNIYKSGQISYYDAVVRITSSEEFGIDSTGNFTVSFFLLHPIIGSIWFDLEDNYYSDLYIEPNKDYDISIKDNELTFIGEGGKLSSEILLYKDSIWDVKSQFLEKVENIHNEITDINKLMEFYKSAENKMLDYLINYKKNNDISAKSYSVLFNQIRYYTAHKHINCRFTFDTNGIPKLRDSLPVNFYYNIYNDYPIENIEDCESQECINYIANYVQVLAWSKETLEKRLNFLKTSKLFNENEKSILMRFWKGELNLKSQEYSNFNYRKENVSRKAEFFNKYYLHLLIQNIREYKANLGRYLILSQGLAKFFLSNNIYPNDSEWATLDSLIISESILKYLKSYKKDTFEKKNTHFNSKQENYKADSTEIMNKYIEKYLGKVIYVDYYATWCAPCRAEIPDAKLLHAEFENEDVIFLNLCAASSEENWKNQIKQNDIKGENYLLSDNENKQLSKIFKVNGYPTYILINRKGEIVNNNAPRPSSGGEIVGFLQSLLNENN